ncbi:hypothetical protein [Nostoc sp.]
MLMTGVAGALSQITATAIACEYISCHHQNHNFRYEALFVVFKIISDW